MLKKFLFASLAATAIIGSAAAADLPSRKAPPLAYVPPAPIFTWTGFYVGVNGGYIANQNRSNVYGTDVTPGPALAGNTAYGPLAAALATGNSSGGSRGGGLAGGQIGFNWQTSSAFVLGVEADIDGVFNGCNNGNNGGFFNNNTNCGFNQTGTLTTAAFPGFPLTGSLSAQQRLRYIGTLRGRVGFLAMPNLLVYGTGGLAYGGVSTNISAAQQILPPGACPVCGPYSTNVNSSTTRVGLAAGGGLEWMFLPGWSLKGEALYYDLGRVRTSTVLNNTYGAGGALPAGSVYTSTAISADTRTRGFIARAGLNYHFGWTNPAPVVARY